MTSSTGLLILEEDDFRLIPSSTNSQNKQPIHHMAHTVTTTRFSIVMFYTDDCRHCKTMKTHLREFVGYPTLQVCMVNVYAADSVSLMNLSQKSTTPLSYVPYLVFYVDGVPFRHFDGNYTLADLKSFVKNVITEAGVARNVEQATEIPPYTIGKPKTSKVCYLSYQKAY